MFHLEAEKELLERICPFENADNINMCQRAYCPFFHEHPHDWLPKQAEDTDDEEDEEEIVEVMALKPSAGPAQSANTSGVQVGDNGASATKNKKPDSPVLIDLTQDSDSAEARDSSDVSDKEGSEMRRRRREKQLSTIDAILPSAVRNKSKKKRFIVSDSDDDDGCGVEMGLEPPGNDKGRKTSAVAEDEKMTSPSSTTTTSSTSSSGGVISHNATMIARHRQRKRQPNPPDIDSRQLIRRHRCTRPRKVLSSNFNCVIRLDDTDFASALKRVGDKRGTVDLGKHPFVARLQEPPSNAFKPNKRHRSINRQIVRSSDDSAPLTSSRFDPARRKRSSERPPTRVKGPNSSRSAPSAIHQKRSNEHLEARSPEGSERKKIKKKKINNNINSNPTVSAHVTAEEIARLNEDLFDERSVLNEEEEKRLKNKLRRQERKRKEQALKRQRNGSTSSSGSAVVCDDGGSSSARPERSDINPVVITKKTRIAHKPQNNGLPPRPNKNGVPPRKKIKSPYEVMQERNLMRQNNEMAKFLANKHKEQQHRRDDINATKTFTEEQKKLLLQRTTSLDSSSSSSPIARLSSKQASSNANSLNAPLIKVQSKSQPRQRQAHQTSNLDQLTKPLVTTRDRVAGVNRSFRQAYVDLIVKKMMKSKKCGSAEAFKFAIEEEERLNQSSRNKLDYRHRMVRLITRVEKSPASPPPPSHTTSSSSTSSPASGNVQVSFKKGQRIAHNADARQAAAVRNRSKSTSTLSTNNSRQHAHLNRNWRDNHQNHQSEKDFYEKLLPYIMTEEQLLENKFPRPTSIKGVCRFKDATAGTYKSNNTRRTCKRCLKEFTVNEYNDDMDMECNYHPGKLYYTKVGASGEKRYSCCNEPPGATACDTADSHVHEENKADNRGYASTNGGVSRSGSCPGVYAIDCEMVYTVVGFELVRVSVISHQFKTVYDKMVMPKGRVLDYNTKFSGVNEKDLIGVTRTLEDVQRDLLTFISPKTILLGHSLESDLVALKMIHSYVVDTSIVFPHNKGPPLKRALRNLMSEHLGIIIQSADSTGHDSTEDASSCIKLMAWRIKQDRRS